MRNNHLEKLYIKYHRELYLYAFSLCREHHLAQDLTSETFFKAILYLDDNVQYIKYWLFRVCKNLFLDYVRKDKEFSNTDELEDILTIEETPLDKVINSEEKRHLYNLIISLRPAYKEILILYYYCDFTLKEISETTGLTKGAAKTLLFRARKKLKTELEGKNEI
ncbi:RNA polymerase sigma factor [Clostridium sp. MSJ-11]|uniref:RNA polymerase sigma factor n=1 Tax=Clostridium mobile TaxID=2841512 RepID=A0ABS6EIQ5_9CLOT|nr:RNA polymerase sigma factor [Clostridium mobile]MBU5484571.1 RNA polymerase sigma factor [Clostridium mobile]